MPVLEGSVYRLHGEFRPADDAQGLLLAGFRVPVAEVFAAGHLS